MRKNVWINRLRFLIENLYLLWIRTRNAHWFWADNVFLLFVYTLIRWYGGGDGCCYCCCSYNFCCCTQIATKMQCACAARDKHKWWESIVGRSRIQQTERAREHTKQRTQRHLWSRLATNQNNFLFAFAQIYLAFDASTRTVSIIMLKILSRRFFSAAAQHSANKTSPPKIRWEKLKNKFVCIRWMITVQTDK